MDDSVINDGLLTPDLLSRSASQLLAHNLKLELV